MCERICRQFMFRHLPMVLFRSPGFRSPGLPARRWLVSLVLVFAWAIGCGKTPSQANTPQRKESIHSAMVHLPNEQNEILRQHFPDFVLPLSQSVEPPAAETLEPPSRSVQIVHGQPLATAVYAGNLQEAQQLIADGHEITYQEYGRSLLHQAAYRGDAAMCTLLIKAGMNPQTQVEQDYRRQTSVHAAIASGSVETLQVMLANGGRLEPVERSSGNRRGPDTSPLLLAIRSNSPEMVEFLIGQGAAVDKTRYLTTALVQMFPENSRERPEDLQRARQIVDILLRENVPLQSRHPTLHPLLAALRTGDAEVVERIRSRLPDEPYTVDHLRAAAESGNTGLCRRIVDAGVAVPELPAPGDELMRYALMQHRNPDLVEVFARAGEKKRYLEQYNVSVGYNRSDRYSHPLYRAALHGDLRFCEYLLEEFRDADGLWEPLKYDPYEYDNDIELYGKGNTPLFAAVFADNAEVLRLLLQDAASKTPSTTTKLDVNTVNTNGETALLEAVRFGAAKCVQVLLANGANAMLANVRGATPLHIILHTPFEHPSFQGTNHAVQADIFPMLIAACMTQARSNEWLQASNRRGQTILHQHATAGYAENCTKLIDLGADVNAKDRRNQTPLHVAMRSRPRQLPGTPRRLGCVETCAVLLDRGTDVRQASAKPEDKYYRVAAENDLFEVCSLLESKGVEPDIQANAGPLLCAAATFGQPQRIEQYLALGADLQATEPRERATALHCAAGRHDVEMCRLLMKHGADPNARDALGQTPAFCIFRRWGTHIARFNTSDPSKTEEAALATLECLLENGADVTVKTRSTSLLDRGGTLLKVFHNLPEPFRELIHRYRPEAAIKTR